VGFDLKVEYLFWNKCEANIKWRYQEEDILIETKFPPRQVEQVKSGNGLVVIFDYNEYGKENGFIFNCDGTIRCKVKLPKLRDILYFNGLYYSAKGLEIIITTRSFDYAGKLNTATGHIIEIHDYR